MVVSQTQPYTLIPRPILFCKTFFHKHFLFTVAVRLTASTSDLSSGLKYRETNDDDGTVGKI